jgi:GT2 family glycosyltransferase
MAFSEARFHILPSWFEAPGLVHIESIRAGTPSIAGTYGNIHEYVDRGVTVVDPWNIGQIRNAARKLWSMRGKPRTRLRQLGSWKDYAASVRSVYREAISSQPGRRGVRRPCFSTPSVGISVVYHNQASCTQRLLESIEAFTPSKGYRLYLFDNGSEPGVHATMENLLRKTGAQYSHMRVEKNRGWIEGANRNFSRTAEPFFVCLNNDVVGAPGWIDKLLTPLMEDPSIWQVGPSEFQGSLQGLHSCNALDKEGEPYYTTNPGVPTYIEGWCFAVRTKQIRDEFGYLYDSEHLQSGYYDDADLSFRIREKGGRLHTVSVPGIQHLIQTTSRTHPNPTHFWRNRRYVVKRWKRFLGECNS